MIPTLDTLNELKMVNDYYMNEDYDIFVVSKIKATRVIIMVILMMTTIMMTIVFTAMIMRSRKRNDDL